VLHKQRERSASALSLRARPAIPNVGAIVLDRPQNTNRVGRDALGAPSVGANIIRPPCRHITDKEKSIMPNVFSKFMNFVGFDSDQELEEGFIDQEPEMSIEDSPLAKRAKVVNINTTAKLDVVVTSPECFEDARDIADHLKQRKPCVINLEGVERETSRRIVDFLSGAVYAVDGNIQKVSSGIFLITPYNVNVMGDFKDELRSKGVFPWS